VNTQDPVTKSLVMVFVLCNPPNRQEIGSAVSRFLKLGHDVMICPYLTPREKAHSKVDLHNMMVYALHDVSAPCQIGRVLLAPKILTLIKHKDDQLLSLYFEVRNAFSGVKIKFAAPLLEARYFIPKINYLSKRLVPNPQVWFFKRPVGHFSDDVLGLPMKRAGFSNFEILNGVLGATTQKDIQDCFAKDNGVGDASMKVSQAIRAYIYERLLYGTHKVRPYTFPVHEGNKAEVQVKQPVQPASA
jgi:hypothetical protein